MTPSPTKDGSRARARAAKAYAVAWRKRRHRGDLPPGNAVAHGSRLAASAPRFLAARRHCRRSGKTMLGMSSSTSRSLPAKARTSLSSNRNLPLVPEFERLCQLGQDNPRIAQRCQRHPPDALREPIGTLRRRLYGEPCLPGPARPDERQQPDIVSSEQLNDLRQFALATQKPGSRHWRIREATPSRSAAKSPSPAPSPAPPPPDL